MRLHLLRPIHDQVELENALQVLEAMAGHRLNAQQEDYFEALSTLVEAYENHHVEEPKVSGIELLRHLLEANELWAADLSRILGRDRSLGVRILSGQRHLTLEHVERLADFFTCLHSHFFPLLKKFRFAA